MGKIYIMTNPSFPQYVKIGYSSNVSRRLKELNRSTAVPYAFRVYATYETPEALSDIQLHHLIDNLNPDLRVRDDLNGKTRTREFYALSAEEAYKILKSIAKISGTEGRLHKTKMSKEERAEELKAEKIRQRRPNFTFGAAHIPVGSEIHFINDDSITATVIDDKKVRYHGEDMSTMALAKLLLHKDDELQGPLYFTYEGERLSDRRDRLEK